MRAVAARAAGIVGVHKLRRHRRDRRQLPRWQVRPGPGLQDGRAVAHFARRFPATNPAWLAFSDDDMHYFVPWFKALLRFVEGAGHSAAVPLALGGRDRKFKTERLQASFPGLGSRTNRAPCLLTGAPRIVLPLVLRRRRPKSWRRFV